MSLVSLTEIQSGRTGSSAPSTVRSYTKVFLVVFDTAYDGPGTAIAGTPGIPQRYSIYRELNGYFDPLALAMDGDSQPVDPENLFCWHVTVKYDTSLWLAIHRRAHSSGQDGNQTDPSNPLSRPAEIKFGWRPHTRVKDIDAQGVAILTSANAPFDASSLEIAEHLPVITISRNEGYFDSQLCKTFKDALNSAPFLGFDTNTVKSIITADTAFESDTYFWKVVYTFEIQSNLIPVVNNPQGNFYGAGPAGANQEWGWDDAILDAGYHILDANGNTSPYTLNGLNTWTLLNGTGATLPGNPPPAVKYYRRTPRYYQRDFSVLNLP